MRGFEPRQNRPLPGIRELALASQVLVHPSHICQIGESDQGLSVVTLRISLHHIHSSLKACDCQHYNWCVGGLVPYFKIGKAVRFRVSDVAAAIERMRIE